MLWVVYSMKKIEEAIVCLKIATDLIYIGGTKRDRGVDDIEDLVRAEERVDRAFLLIQEAKEEMALKRLNSTPPEPVPEICEDCGCRH